MKVNIKRAAWYWLLAYWIITLIGVAVTILVGVLGNLPSAAEAGVSVGRSPAFLASMPWHWAFNLPVWLIFSRMYLRKIGSARELFKGELMQLALFWTGISIILDLVFWVLIPTPVQMSFYEMYVIYGAYLLLVYLSIFVSPLLMAPQLKGMIFRFKV